MRGVSYGAYEALAGGATCATHVLGYEGGPIDAKGREGGVGGNARNNIVVHTAIVVVSRVLLVFCCWR